MRPSTAGECNLPRDAGEPRGTGPGRLTRAAGRHSLCPARSFVKPIGFLLSAVCLAATPVGAQDWLARIEAEARRIEPQIVQIRHQIHQNPELSNREEKTAALVAGYLRDLGLDVKTGVAKHGVVALLRGGRPGPVVAVRADMDALPVTEQTDLPFASKVRAT